VTRADAVLKGVLPIGSCYTKGDVVRVTVGIKSESLANAVSLEKTMGSESAATYRTSPDQVTPAVGPGKLEPSNPLEGTTKSYSGDKGIKNF